MNHLLSRRALHGGVLAACVFLAISRFRADEAWATTANIPKQATTEKPAPLTPAPQRTDTERPDDAPRWASETLTVTGKRQGYSTPDADTATKTQTPLITIPQSVQVITRALIQEQDRRTLGDALVNVSGVTPNRPEEGLLAGPIVRGFLAEIYQDGLPMYGSTEAANDPTSMIGVSRIEVLKGPTSALYGGGVGSPLGGLINIETERPNEKLGGYAAFRTGSYATVDPYADVNIPLARGIAARIAGEYQSNSSWIDLVRERRWSVQPSLSFQLGAKTDLLIKGQFNQRNQLEYSGLPAAQALAGKLDRNAFPGAANGQPYTTIDNKMVTLILRHHFNDHLKLTVSGRYYNSEIPEYGSFVYPQLYPAASATPTTYPIVPLNMMGRVKEGTFDANLAAKYRILGGTHEFLLGVDYDHTDFSSDMGFSGLPVGELDLSNPAYTLSFGAIQPLTITQTDHYQTLAGYVQDQANYGRFHLTGSLRYTSLHFKEHEEGTNRTFHRVAPRIGGTFDLIHGVAVYVGYETAFRGAFGLVSLQPPKPETSRNVEAGLKFALDKEGLSGTIAVYEQTRNNVATANPINPLYSIQTGQERARGVEADMMWEPTPAFSLIANFAYTDATVTKDSSIPAGNRLPRVPKYSGRIAARYRVLTGLFKGLSFGTGLTAFSAREITLPNTVSVPGYPMVDAQASYSFDRYTVQVSAANLNGTKAYDTYQYLSFPVVMPVQPRSAYVSLKIRL